MSASFEKFPGVGELGKIYVDRSTNKTYRYSRAGGTGAASVASSTIHDITSDNYTPPSVGESEGIPASISFSQAFLDSSVISFG